MGFPFHKNPDKQLVHYTVEAIIEGLRSSDGAVLEYVYRMYFPSIRFFVIRNSGSDEDAQDVFQEAMILIYKKIKRDDLELTCAFKSYLYSVCRLLWLQQLDNRQIKLTTLTENEVYIKIDDQIEQEYKEQERYRLYQKHFKTLKPECQEILKLVLRKVPLKEMARIMNVRSEHFLKKKKYECKDMLIKRIQNDLNFKYLKDEW